MIYYFYVLKISKTIFVISACSKNTDTKKNKTFKKKSSKKEILNEIQMVTPQADIITLESDPESEEDESSSESGSDVSSL